MESFWLNVCFLCLVLHLCISRSQRYAANTVHSKNTSEEWTLVFSDSLPQIHLRETSKQSKPKCSQFHQIFTELEFYKGWIISPPSQSFIIKSIWKVESKHRSRHFGVSCPLGANSTKWSNVFVGLALKELKMLHRKYHSMPSLN